MTERVEHIGPDGEVSRLPDGERVLWTGAPDRRALARWFLRERWLLAFVAFSFCLGAADALQHTEGAVPRLLGVATLSAVMALVAIASVRLFAWQLAKTSRYVITNRRLYFNIGIVMRADANVPFAHIETIDLRHRADGTADLMVTLAGEQEIPWLLLFPHMTWRGARRGRPTFRALRTHAAAAEAIAGALRANDLQPAPADGQGRPVAITTAGARHSRGAAAPSPA